MIQTISSTYGSPPEPVRRLYRKWLRSVRLTNACVLALAILLTIGGCADASTQWRPSQPGTILPTTVLPTFTPTPFSVFPMFSDWRAAYQTPDGHLHVVTLDGTNDIAGPALPGMDSSFTGLHFANAGVSPDGHVLAYAANPGLSILDVSGRTSVPSEPPPDVIYEMFWSSDGSELALGNGVGSLYLAKPFTGSSGRHANPIPGTPGPWAPGLGIGNLLGWVDGTHVAVTVAPTGNSITLGVLNVYTGALRRVAIIRSTSLGSYRFALSPDGSMALFYNRPFRDDPYTPQVDLISITTGAITPLPAINQATRSAFTSVAWRRGTSMVAVSTGFAVNGDLRTWVLDVQHDTAWHLTDGYYAMGWAPSSSTLVVSAYNQFEVGQGPFEIDAITVTPDHHSTRVVLTRNAVSFPFVGFVRTA